MTISTQRAIDRFAGIPLCIVAALLRRLASRRPVAEDPRQWQSVLVLKFFGLGSIVQATAFVHALRSLNPKARIFFLTFAGNSEMAERIPGVTDSCTISTESLPVFIRDTLRALSRVRSAGPDVAFDLEFFSKFSTLLGLLSGAPLRVGYALPARWRIWSLTHPTLLDTSGHIADSFLSLLQRFTASDVSTGTPDFRRATAAERRAIDDALDLHVRDSPLVCVNINAGATSLERRWPAERFMKVVRVLLERHPGGRFIFIGARDERAYVAGAIAATGLMSGRVENFAGMTSLGELIALLERADLLLTNDSGPMHLAAVLGTPTVALFGPESPRVYLPRGNVNVIYKPMECSPCLNVYNAKLFRCPYQARCMREISPDEVTAAARQLLSNRAASQGWAV
jgi:ADP-heptose:LPS heptosyltransferase